jgi:hypothetical protein
MPVLEHCVFEFGIRKKTEKKVKEDAPLMLLCPPPRYVSLLHSVTSLP